jgi:hypothetical protein
VRLTRQSQLQEHSGGKPFSRTPSAQKEDKKKKREFCQSAAADTKKRFKCQSAAALREGASNTEYTNSAYNTERGKERMANCN